MGAKVHKKEMVSVCSASSPDCGTIRAMEPPKKGRRSGPGCERRVQRHALGHHPARHFNDLGFAGLGGGAFG